MTQFFKHLCEDNEIQHIVASVRNELGVVAESYGHVNIKNTSLQCHMAHYNDGMLV